MRATRGRRKGGVCVFSESGDVALELLGIGRTLAEGLRRPLAAVVLDDESASTMVDPLRRRADEVLVARSTKRAGAGETEIVSTPEVCLEVLARAVAQTGPDVVLVGGTSLGTEVAARLAQRLRTGCATDCIELALDPRGLLVQRRCLGRYVARQLVVGRPAVATVPPRRFDPSPGTASSAGRCSHLEVTWPPPRVRRLQVRKRERSSREIERAAVIVAVGRGVRAAADLQLAEALAATLGGALAATRPLTDHLGWLPIDVKIGLSGRTVTPELYIACGVSGQLEHVVGMRGARIVVAINTDPEAPIFEQADYRIVGDLYEIVPALTAAFSALLHERPPSSTVPQDGRRS